MTLSRNTASVPLVGGIDTKTAKTLLPSGAFINLQNTVRRQKGKLQKRWGFSSLANTTSDDLEIDDGKRLDTLSDELLLFNRSALYSYFSATNTWVAKGTTVPVVVDTKQIVRNTDSQSMADAAVLSGIELFAWEDSRGGIRYSIRDTVTGATVVHDQEASSQGVRPKVTAVGDALILTYIDGSDFLCRRVLIGQPTVLQAQQSIEAGSAEDAPYDIAAFGNVAIWAYNTATVLRVGYLLESGVAGSSGSNGYPDPLALLLPGTSAVNVAIDTVANVFYVTYHDAAGSAADEVTVTAITEDLVTSDTDTLATVADVCNITGVRSADSTITVYYEVSAAAGYNHLVRHGTASYSGGNLTLDDDGVFKRSVGLSTKAVNWNDTPYVGLVHESVLQSTYFIVRSDGTLAARYQVGLASGLTRDTSGVLKSGLPNLSALSGMTFFAPLSVRNRVTTLDSTIQAANIGLIRSYIEFDTTDFDTAVAGKSLVIAGGAPSAYDGVAPIELGFHLYPENITTAAAGSGSLTASSSYRLQVVYEWTDSKGQIHRSAPSISVTQALGVGEDEIVVTAPTLRLTGKSGVKVVVYRTKSNETTVYYRDNEAANNAAANTVTINLTQADSTLADNEILYTVGGAVDHIMPPSCRSAHVHKERVFLTGCEDDTVWYSKRIVENEGVAFNDGQRIRLSKVIASASLDDKLVLFRANKIFTQVGDGPLDTGAQNDYGDPQPHPSDEGCIEARSIIETPLGIMFKSAKGIQLLDRGLKIIYIGAGVEAFNDLTITSAVVIEDNNEVRFTTSDGVCLVYNYDFNEWHTFTNYEAVGACSALGSYCHLKADGTVNREVPGQYLDNGSSYSQVIETNWFQLAKIQGFQRIYEWSLLGEFESHCLARVKLAYDFEQVYTETVYFNTQDGLGTEVYGDGVYGEAEVYGGVGSQVFQFRSKPATQKCEAIKLLISDIDTIDPGVGGCFSLTNAAFEFGYKVGLKKHSASKTRGI